MIFGILARLLRWGRDLPTGSEKAKALVLFALLLWYASSGFLYFELPNKPDLGWGDALWWALVTMATVGYGDLFPVTAGGRYLIGIPTMVFGIGFLGYIISLIANALFESRSRRLKGMLDLKLSGHILLVNYPSLEAVRRLANELRADPATRARSLVLVDELLEELPLELGALGVHYVRGDATQETTLRRASAEAASHAVILVRDPGNPHSDDNNLVTTLALETLNPKLFTVVEVVSPAKVRHVELAGADSVICMAQLSAGLIVHELQDPGVKDLVHDLVSNLGGHQFYVARLGAMRAWTYDELVRWGLGQRVSIVGIRRDGRDLLGCAADEPLRATDSVLLIGAARIERIDTTAARA